MFPVWMLARWGATGCKISAGTSHDFILILMWSCVFCFASSLIRAPNPIYCLSQKGAIMQFFFFLAKTCPFLHEWVIYLRIHLILLILGIASPTCVSGYNKIYLLVLTSDCVSKRPDFSFSFKQIPSRLFFLILSRVILENIGISWAYTFFPLHACLSISKCTPMSCTLPFTNVSI